MQNCLPSRLTLTGSPIHSALNEMCSGEDKVDLAHRAACSRGQTKSNMQTRSCSCQPEMQRLNQFCGQVNLWHRAKRMENSKKRVFSCTWGKTASSLRKGCALKGWETKRWHKLYSGDTRKKTNPKTLKKQNSSISLCNMVSLVFVRREIFTDRFI